MDECGELRVKGWWWTSMQVHGSAGSSRYIKLCNVGWMAPQTHQQRGWRSKNRNSTIIKIYMFIVVVKNTVVFMSGRSLCSSQLIRKGQTGVKAETLRWISESQSNSPQFIMKNQWDRKGKKNSNRSNPDITQNEKGFSSKTKQNKKTLL